MLRNLRASLSGFGRWIAANRLAALAIGLLIAATAGGVYLLTTEDAGEQPTPAPAPRVVADDATTDEPQRAEAVTDLGFPAFATKNTTRVAGADAVADAAGVALAVHPATGGIAGPSAVTLVDAGDWQGAVAASALVAAPVGAPILLTEDGEVPELSAEALRALDPRGSADTAGRQAFVVGAAARPDGYESLKLEGADPAELAVEIDRLRQRLVGEPRHIILAGSDDPAYAMPAAAWAARSGDPVLFTGRDRIPKATLRALESHARVPVYVLGPGSVVSEEVLKQVKKLDSAVERVGEEGPAENSIAFARYASAGFGWNINDPGHGLVIASAGRPVDAGAAAPLSASGTWGALLVTEDGGAVPDTLRGYLLDIKPGYQDDPTRAVYNHVWLIGDTSAISVGFQAQIDELAEVAPVTSGSGGQTVPPSAGEPEFQPQPKQEDEASTDGDQRR